LVGLDVLSYVLTSLGAAAIRRGSLLDCDEEFMFIAGAPVYRRPVILALLDHEMKRLRHLKSEFSVLLAEVEPEETSDAGVTALPSCLTRLRQCLREVDLIGQLADALYVVILPQTKERAAKALRERILAALAPRPPLVLSIIEITEPHHLEQVLAHQSGLGRPA
jgi:GGDEF domain-containing protein